MRPKQSSFVPNSFQTPNAYVDVFMPYLTGEEYKVLSYATRRILGFQKRQDRISISQFTEGTRNKGGDILDTGTGIGIEAVKKALANLVLFGLMIRVAENDPHTNAGVLWSLQWDDQQINWQLLEERESQNSTVNWNRIQKARSVRQAHLVRQTDPCATERGRACETDPPSTCGTETQNPGETQEKEEDINLSVFLFERICEFMRPQMTRNNFTFLQAALPVSFEESVLTLAVRDETTRDWLDDRLSSTINRSFPGIIGEDASVKFVVLQEMAQE